ncbi:methylmalonyl-CoA mutase large subunit [gut metagenome]|uniref:methylmalonyl-CoA mutase n=1 Tax=gut metagenome TaxID=749906 RepID=J9G824_9ZZZZ
MSIDNTAVRNAQIKRLEKLRAERDNDKVQQDLVAITKAAETRDNGNLLEMAVQAARDRASLGEISDAVEKVSGRFNAVIHTVSGVYSTAFGGSDDLVEANKLADEFEKLEGRRPRIFLAKMGQDGHDRGQKVLATSFADMGWDVDVGPLFQTPEETAQDAVDNDVHMVGFSSLAAGHKTLLPALVEELAKLGRDDILVSIGGVIPAQDYDYLYEHGAAAIFGPGTNIPKCCIQLLKMLVERAKEEAKEE